MNAQIYSLLLTLCPADLQREFGAEMTQVFLDDLVDHQRRFGFRGIARVWRRSLYELCGVALQDAITQRLFDVPLIMFGLMESYFGLILLTHREPSPLHDILTVFLAWPGVMSIVGFVAARVANRSVPVPLSLRS